MSKEAFVKLLVSAGWSPDEAAEEYERITHNDDGTENDCGL